MTRDNPYEMGIDKNEANFGALSPPSFIERSASVYGMRGRRAVLGTGRGARRRGSGARLRGDRPDAAHTSDGFAASATDGAATWNGGRASRDAQRAAGSLLRHRDVAAAARHSQPDDLHQPPGPGQTNGFRVYRPTIDVEASTCLLLARSNVCRVMSSGKSRCSTSKA